jgi:prepilin-type N-terminal cleavage/methylation domain-containing protein
MAGILTLKKSKGGFTLIELLVVIAIISLLSSVVFASLNSARAKARDAKRVSDLQQIRYALELLYPTPSLSGSWVDVWTRFQNCLENGQECYCSTGAPSCNAVNYIPVISNINQDPLYAGTSNAYVYSPKDNTNNCSANVGQIYRLKATLETEGHSVFSSDLDGDFYNNNGRCEDANRGYCIGVGTCDGWN